MNSPSRTQESAFFLSDQQRDQLAAELDREGFVVLPDRLPVRLLERVLAANRRLAGERLKSPERESLKLHDCVSLDPAYRELMMYPPALQLAHDALGPCYHL